MIVVTIVCECVPLALCFQNFEVTDEKTKVTHIIYHKSQTNHLYSIKFSFIVVGGG